MPRVLIAGLFHETHTFLDGVTKLDEFQIRRGEELLAMAGDGSPLGSALEAGNRLGWEWVPTVDYRAQPSATVDDEVYSQFWQEPIPPLQGIDAVYLVLHGAMVTTKRQDIEGDLLSRLSLLPGIRGTRGVRSVYGDRGSLGAKGILGERGVPIFGVFDLHASSSPLMAQYSDCLVAYRENPHADANAMAVHAAELLERTLKSEQCPRTYYRHARIIWPPTGTCTADSPMRDLEALARQLEREHPEVWVINVIGGFAFADTESTGVSFTVCTTGDEATANAILDQLCELARELRESGNVVDPPLDEVMARLREPLDGLTVIAEPSDNIGGGAPGDGTGLLRAFVEHRLQNAAICICDPAAVVSLQSMDIGQRVSLPIGGRGSRFDPGPLTLEVELVSRSGGKFRLEDPHSHLASMFGAEFDMGPCAVVKHGSITILLNSRKTPPFDLGQWRSQGIEPARLAVIAAKAAVAHRNAYAPIAARLWSADTPGPCRSDVRQLPYRYVPRDVYPLA